MPRNNNNNRWQEQAYERWGNRQREFEQEMAAAAEEAAPQAGEQLIGPNNLEAIRARILASRPEINYKGTMAAPAARKSRRANRKSRRANRKARKSRKSNRK